MSDEELAKIAANAAKHILGDGHLDKIIDAAKKHGKPFRAQQNIQREKPPSATLVKLRKQSKADIFLYGKRDHD